MEKFNLNWNKFDENIIASFQSLKHDQDFTDVTLVCEENKQLKAHKVLISACSEFFKRILIQNPHQHPLIYLNGISFTQLQSIIDFAYSGQTEVDQDKLDSFLIAAKTLEIKGLSTNEVKKDEVNIVYLEAVEDEMTLEEVEDEMSLEAVGEEMTIEPASFNKITDTSSVNLSSMPHCSDTPPLEVFETDKIEDNIHISNNPDI